MSLRIGQKVFAPSLLATVLTLLLLPIFINLGLWQLRRADEKRALMQQAVTGQSQLVELTSTNADQLPRYQHVTVEGVFSVDHQVLLDSMPSYQGQPGYRVWTLLTLSDHSSVIVDRGWISNNVVSQPKFPGTLEVSTRTRTITGIIDELPRPGIRAGELTYGTAWPLVLNFPTIDEMRGIFDAKLQSRIILMDIDNPDGFDRHWQIKQGFTPERHIAYAVQWFGFAITLIVIYVVVNLKREPS